MTSFRDTADWKLVNGTTLSYSYQHQGKQQTSQSEKRPVSLYVQMVRLSLHRDMWWERHNPKRPETKAGYSGREYISGLGVLINSKLHAITLDSTPNESFTQIFITIYPVDETKLIETSVADGWVSIGEEKAPEEGWLKDELGRITFHSEGEYHESSEVFATLHMSKEKFHELAEAVSANKLHAVQLEILADLFGLAYEGMLPGFSTVYNHAILCRDDGQSAYGTSKGFRGEVNARLQGLQLEWSPKLDPQNVRQRDELHANITTDTPLLDGIKTQGPNTSEQLVHDVRGVRSKIDQIYSALFLGLVVFAVSSLLEWWRG